MAGEKLICFDFDETLVNGHFHSTLMNAYSQGRGNAPACREMGVQIRQSHGEFNRYSNGTHAETVPPNQGASQEWIDYLISTGLKYPEQMANTMKQAIDNGHKVAITSFTLFPEVAVPTLKAILGSIMSPQDADRYVNQICVVGGYPSNGVTSDLLRDNEGKVIGKDPQFYGKEEHINAAIFHFQQQGLNISRADTMLVDDSQANCAIAQQRGPAVQVPKPPQPVTDSYFAQVRSHVAVNLRNIVSAQSVAPQQSAQPILQNPVPTYTPVALSRTLNNQQRGPIPQPPPQVAHQAPNAQPTRPNPPTRGTQEEQYQQFSQLVQPNPGPIPQPPRQNPPTKGTQEEQYQQFSKLISNPRLDALLSQDLNELTKQYQNNKTAAHQNDGTLTSLFNRAKNTVNSINGTRDLRTNQLASIVNVFAELKNSNSPPEDKAVIAYAHLENLKQDNHSSGMRQLCVQLQSKIKDEYPNVVEKGVKPEFKQQAKAFANPQPSKVENEKKLR